MLKKGKKHLKGIVIGLIILVLVVGVFIKNNLEPENYKFKYEGSDLSANVEGMGRDNTYTTYLDHNSEKYPDKSIEVNLFDYTDSNHIEIKENYEGEEKVLLSEEDGFVEWEVYVAEEGYYNLYMEYFPVESRGVDIERGIYINGEIPFLGSENLVFARIWTDSGEVKKDNQGNDIRPSQVESPRWESAFFKDSMGYIVEPYKYYFKEGLNRVKMESINEPVAIRRLELTSVVEQTYYNSYVERAQINSNLEASSDYIKVIQGEDSSYRSSPSLYATYDRSSSNTEPYSASKIRLNMTGNSWKVAGQWIEWEIDVPEDGLYHVSFKARQNYNRGFVSNRSLYIDGEIPFEEVSVIEFQYSNEWNLITLSDENDTPYEFALTEGKHTIRLEVTLGELGAILDVMEESVYRLNTMYRKILVLTGTKPDKYRDYQVDKVYPEVMESMELESKVLYKIIDDLAEYSGQKASQVAAAQTIAKQLERFIENPEDIPSGMKNMKDNIGALGTSILALSEAPLDVDYLIVSGTGTELPEVNETFFDKVGHELRSFVASFSEDYNAIGNVYDTKESLEVWILSGRDQSTILKTMIDDTFTPDSGITVNVKLISPEVLLPSVVAGTGPDVALTVGQGEPVNYALRGAAVDLSGFEGFEELASEYYDSSFVPFQFEGGVYGIPETLNFTVLFYREDILEELGVEVPNTWDELIDIMPTIQKNNMSIGIPSSERKINGTRNPDISAFFAQLYQKGGSLYNEEGSESIIDTDLGVEAFEFYTMLYTHYGLPLEYDFVNRFRTGEMPLGIIDYNTFNTLSVFAPEIRGLWSFVPMPGTEKEDGTIDRSCSTWGNCSMMLSGAENKEDAWEFLSWWASSETQVRFGRELEAVMGASARYATANATAFGQLAWSTKDAAAIEEQWKWAIGTPEVPGGYYTQRHIVNAFRNVVNNSEDPRETLLDYTRTINDEIKKKRLEFGLD